MRYGSQLVAGSGSKIPDFWQDRILDEDDDVGEIEKKGVEDF